MTRPARRKKTFRKPDYWSNEPPPKPGPGSRHENSDRPDPTRFGDWEKDGIAIDF